MCSLECSNALNSIIGIFSDRDYIQIALYLPIQYFYWPLYTVFTDTEAKVLL